MRPTTEQLTLFDDDGPRRKDPRWLDLFGDADPDLIKKFYQYHSDNPHIWDLFVKYSLQAKRDGRKRFSHWMVMNRIRWYTAVETTGEDFKISNDFIACYARHLVYRRPEFEGFFSLKQMKSKRSKART